MWNLKRFIPDFWLCTKMRLKCLFCLRKSNWMLYFCCRNVVLLFSLFIVLVEGDIDSSGGVKSHLSLLNDNLSKMSLMNLPVLMKVFLHFADAGIHATSTGKYLCAFSPVSISSLYYLTCSPSHLFLSHMYNILPLSVRQRFYIWWSSYRLVCVGFGCE